MKGVHHTTYMQLLAFNIINIASILWSKVLIPSLCFFPSSEKRAAQLYLQGNTAHVSQDSVCCVSARAASRTQPPYQWPSGSSHYLHHSEDPVLVLPHNVHLVFTHCTAKFKIQSTIYTFFFFWRLVSSNLKYPPDKSKSDVQNLHMCTG